MGVVDFEKNIKKWFAEGKTSKTEEFSYRFTSKESKLFSSNCMFVIATLLECPGLHQTQKIKLFSLAFHSLILRNCVYILECLLQQKTLTCLKKTVSNMRMSVQCLLLSFLRQLVILV